jgi:hypothetical protein
MQTCSPEKKGFFVAENLCFKPVTLRYSAIGSIPSGFTPRRWPSQNS